MMHSNSFKTLLLLFFFLPAFGAGKNNLYKLKLKSSKGEFQEKMEVFYTSSGFVVEYFDKNGESSKNEFDNENRPKRVTYFNKENKPYLNLDFNYLKNEITSTGNINKTYDLEVPVYDANGAVFFLFSRILPPEGKEYKFNLLQSKDKRIVEMRLKFAGKEELKIGTQKIICLKYETGLVSRILSFFWPYKYYYWYEEKTHQFVKYEGPFGHENSEVIEVVRPLP